MQLYSRINAIIRYAYAAARQMDLTNRKAQTKNMIVKGFNPYSIIA